MGYNTYHWGELEIIGEPNDEIKKHFKKERGGLVDASGLWFLVCSQDSNGASKWSLERDECTRNSGPAEGLQGLIDNVFAPNGIILNGTIEWLGDHNDDRGNVAVTNNQMTVYYGYTVYLDQDGNPSPDTSMFLADMNKKFRESKEVQNHEGK